MRVVASPVPSLWSRVARVNPGGSREVERGERGRERYVEGEGERGKERMEVKM